jgi:hypothetical protein
LLQDADDSTDPPTRREDPDSTGAEKKSSEPAAESIEAEDTSADKTTEPVAESKEAKDTTTDDSESKTTDTATSESSDDLTAIN